MSCNILQVLLEKLASCLNDDNVETIEHMIQESVVYNMEESHKINFAGVSFSATIDSETILSGTIPYELQLQFYDVPSTMFPFVDVENPR